MVENSDKVKEVMAPIFSKYESNILTVVARGLTCICVIVILIIMVKQIRLLSFMSSLGVSKFDTANKSILFG